MNVNVKPLVWVSCDDGDFASTPFGVIDVCLDGSGVTWMYSWVRASHVSAGYATAAAPDFDTRCTAVSRWLTWFYDRVIVPDPVPPPEPTPVPPKPPEEVTNEQGR